jgi:SAM-dependent methyltransferase
MRPEEDAYGQAMLDHFHGKEAWEVVEQRVARPEGGCRAFRSARRSAAPPKPRRWFLHDRCWAQPLFRAREEWRESEQKAMGHVRGRVLDIGCGAGRVALHLEALGHEVVGIDLSPAAIETCRLRGVTDARVMSIDDVDASLGTFDTIVMLGGNLGLLGNRERGRRILTNLADTTSDDALILGTSRDRTGSTDPDIVDYFSKNLKQGRISGQGRIRIRYRKHVTPWFDFLRMTVDELRALLTGTGWRLQDTIQSDDTLYVAVLEKDR